MKIFFFRFQRQEAGRVLPVGCSVHGSIVDTDVPGSCQEKNTWTDSTFVHVGVCNGSKHQHANLSI